MARSLIYSVALSLVCGFVFDGAGSPTTSSKITVYSTSTVTDVFVCIEGSNGLCSLNTSGGPWTNISIPASATQVAAPSNTNNPLTLPSAPNTTIALATPSLQISPSWISAAASSSNDYGVASDMSAPSAMSQDTFPAAVPTLADQNPTSTEASMPSNTAESDSNSDSTSAATDAVAPAEAPGSSTATTAAVPSMASDSAWPTNIADSAMGTMAISTALEPTCNCPCACPAGAAASSTVMAAAASDVSQASAVESSVPPAVTAPSSLPAAQSSGTPIENDFPSGAAGASSTLAGNQSDLASAATTTEAAAAASSSFLFSDETATDLAPLPTDLGTNTATFADSSATTGINFDTSAAPTVASSAAVSGNLTSPQSTPPVFNGKASREAMDWMLRWSCLGFSIGMSACFVYLG